MKKLTQFVRGKTWISASFSEAKLWDLLNRDVVPGNCVATSGFILFQFVLIVISLFKVAFTQEDLDRFKDPEYYKQFRHDLEHDLNVSSNDALPSFII